MKKIFRLILTVAISLFVGAQARLMLLAICPSQTDTSMNVTSEIGTAWRQTRFGWQDSNRWVVDSFVPRQSFEVIHPLIWAALVLIAVIAVMIWSSEEWDIARFFNR